MSVNTALAKPNYRLHRAVAGSPVVADNSDLVVLKTLTVVGGSIERRDIYDAGGWKTVRGVVQLTGGTSVDLVPLEMASLKDPNGTVTTVFVPLASAITGLADGDTFTVTINGGRMFMRIDVVTGAVTLAEIFLAGAEAMNVMPGAHRAL
jgi:hypothetical protein